MFNASLRGNKVHFTSLGCPRNLVDTEVMLGILLKAGFEATPDECSADYLVINTCGFLEASRQESLDTIQYLLEKKKTNAKLVVTGCMVQHHKEEIKSKIPEVNYLLGSGDVNQILELIQEEENKELVTSARSYLEAGEIPRKLSTPKNYAYLKIAEGCRKRCAFCIIPKIKGPLKSKPKEQIIKEFHTLLNQGVQEIILIAQDLGDYGKERVAKLTAPLGKEIGKDFANREELIAETIDDERDAKDLPICEPRGVGGFATLSKDSEQKEGLTNLLKEMLSSTKTHFWLRLLYLYPDEITDELIELLKSDPRICHYLDMPIQHVSDPILTAMRRKTSKADIIATLTKLRKEIPDIVIRTSLMVGFPGETDKEFQELKAFIKEYPLDHIGIFKFSKEKGSAAYSFENQVDEKVKEERFQELMQVQQKIVAKRNKKWIGKKIPVMIDGVHPESDLLLVGRTYGQCPEIDGQVIINDARCVKNLGTLYLVEITEAVGYDLVGRAIEQIQKKKESKSLRLVPSAN